VPVWNFAPCTSSYLFIFTWFLFPPFSFPFPVSFPFCLFTVPRVISPNSPGESGSTLWAPPAGPDETWPTNGCWCTVSWKSRFTKTWFSTHNAPETVSVFRFLIDICFVVTVQEVVIVCSDVNIIQIYRSSIITGTVIFNSQCISTRLSARFRPGPLGELTVLIQIPRSCQMIRCALWPVLALHGRRSHRSWGTWPPLLETKGTGENNLEMIHISHMLLSRLYTNVTAVSALFWRIRLN